jgi:anti-anti-sigma regulatory factor
VVSLRGDVDADAHAELSALAVVADDAPALVVDLSEVSFVDVVGLDLLEELARRPNVSLRRPTSTVVRLLERTAGVVDEWSELRRTLV